jgi:hypothetical protein
VTAMTSRDKRALLLGAPLMLIMIIIVLARREPATPVAAATESVPQAEKKLAKLRLLAATVPGKEQLLKQVSGELAEREKGMIVADTAQQAQAQIQQIIRKVAAAEGIEVRGAEFGPVKPLGADYGEAPVGVTFDCGIEQLVNLLASIGSQPQLLGTSELRVSAGNAKEKKINVRLTVSGVVPKKLVPEKKGIASF